MAYEFKLPDLGEGLTEGEIAKWLVAEGDEIAEDEPLVEIQTDKTTVEIPSPAAGKIVRILVDEGEIAPVGAVLVVIGEDAGEAPPARVQATPLVRKIAQELGVDLESVTPTGPGGRITETAVRGAAVPVAAEGRREKVRGVRRRLDRHGDQRREAGRADGDAAGQLPGGGARRRPPHRTATGRPRRRGRRAPDGQRQRHVRPPGRRRRPRRRVRPHRDREPAELT